MINNSNGLVFQSNLSYQLHKKFTKLDNQKSTIILNGSPILFNQKSQTSLYKEYFPNLAIVASFRPPKRLIESIRLINELKKLIKKLSYM